MSLPLPKGMISVNESTIGLDRLAGNFVFRSVARDGWISDTVSVNVWDTLFALIGTDVRCHKGHFWTVKEIHVAESGLIVRAMRVTRKGNVRHYWAMLVPGDPYTSPDNDETVTLSYPL
jgi:hypothetical protein